MTIHIQKYPSFDDQPRFMFHIYPQLAMSKGPRQAMTKTFLKERERRAAMSDEAVVAGAIWC